MIRSFRGLAAAAVALAAIVAPAAIPTAAAQTAPAAPAAPSAPASQLSPSQLNPTHVALAREVALLANLDNAIMNLMPDFVAGLRQIAVTRPEISKDLDEVIGRVRLEIEARREEVIDFSARAYAQRMTEAELREVANFYKSPAGRKFVDTETVVSNETFRELGLWAQRMSEFAVDRVRAEMAKKGHQIN